MEDIIKEQFISDYPLPISKEQTEKIISQMKSSVVKIYKGGFKGTGFLCKIPEFDSKKISYFLITNHHVLKEDDIKLDSIISFSISDQSQLKSLSLSSNRKIFTNETLDVTFIEIFPEKDQLIKNNFLEIDENINQNGETLKNYYIKKPYIQ